MSSKHKQSKAKKGGRPRNHRRGNSLIKKQKLSNPHLKELTNKNYPSGYFEFKSIKRNYLTKIQNKFISLCKSMEIYEKWEFEKEPIHPALISQIQRQCSKLETSLANLPEISEKYQTQISKIQEKYKIIKRKLEKQEFDVYLKIINNF